MAQSFANANSSYLNDHDLDAHSKRVFEFICQQDLPQIEDESPPPGFYEVLYTYTNQVEEELPPQECDNGTQTCSHIGEGDGNYVTEMHNAPVAVPEPEPEPGAEQELEPDATMDTQTQQTQTDARSFYSLESLQQRIRLLRQHSTWSVVKMLLLIVSLLHSSYMLCNYASRSGLIQRLFVSMQPEATPPPPPQSRPLPVFIWVQLCRLARKLHLI